MSREELREIGEAALVRRIRDAAPPAPSGVVLGIGDDAALLEPARGWQVATCDTLVENVHFRRESFSPRDVGWKSLAVSLSDVAAMGGTPRYCLVSLALPPDMSAAWVEGFYAGLHELAERYEVALVGGDTVRAQAVTVSVTVLGEVPVGRALRRAGAHPGERLLVTGTLGKGMAGLWAMEGRCPPREELLQAQRRPLPRLEEGRRLASGGATAADDVSDGLASELRELAEAGRVGFRVFLDRLPLSAAVRRAAAVVGRPAWEPALFGGEDYELLCTAPVPAAGRLISEVVGATGTPLTVVGEVLPAGEGIRVVEASGRERPLEGWGWDSFR